MRKRLIGKAFAIAMSGAMVLTATPVTANIFHVAHIVKAANDAQQDEWTYCYVGLTWAEYWANEGVYNANDTSSSDVEDSHYEKDKGGYDVVTRATTNHGLHRGSFQGNAVIEAKASDDTTKEFSVSHWSKDGKKFYQSSTDATGVSYAKGTITDTDGTQYKLTSYEVKGTKYVPVKVKTTDLDALKANHTVVENGGTLVGGYGENQLKSYQKTANVTANTYGLKTATKQEDGSFIFSARSNEGTESGVKDEALKEATGVTPNLRSGDAVGSYGETLRLDLNGDYGDLGANLQSVKWTFYGDDSTYTTPVKTYGTKFAADNWMHKSMGIQLGLTESARFDLSGDAAVGYWSVTVSALGYKDYTYKFHADKENIAQHVVIASDSDEVKALQSTIKTADSYLEKETEYCAKPYSDFKTEYKEAQDALKHDTLYKANILEANTHLSNAIESLTKPEYKEVVKAATLEKDGSIDDTCVNCGDVRKSTPIAKIASINLDKTSFTENGQAQKPSVTVKDSTGAVISADNYTVSYSDANSTKAGTYKVTVKFNGKKYAGTKELSYTISAKPAATTTVTNAATVKAPAKTTVKLSKAKKTSIKVSWKKVSGVAAYQIQYSTSKNFKKAKTVKVSAKSASKVLKKLKKNKKYYVRVRSYKVTKVNNKSKNVYSAWSAKKALKTKKK